MNLKLCFVLTAVFALGALRADEMWMTDFEAAKAKAAKEGKMLLMDFTGSDWCGWCIKLKKEVFDQPSFMAEAPKKFVFVELDYPSKKKLPAELKAQNDSLKAKYGIKGFPTIIIADAKGEKIAQTGYKAGGPDKYIEHLNELASAPAKRAELEAAAAKASGPEKLAKLEELVKVCIALQDEKAAAKAMEDIIAADADDAAGLKTKYTTKLGLQDVSRTAQGGNLDEALKKLEPLLANEKLKGEDRQNAMFLKGIVLARSKKFTESLSVMEEMVKIDPSTRYGKQGTQVIESLKKDIEKSKP